MTCELNLSLGELLISGCLIRRISVAEVRQAIASGEVIEDYPDDKYGPSCLISGFTQAERPLHIITESGGRNEKQHSKRNNG